ncbi:hypothetical protein CsatB_029668 [Cannabis sativa]
MDYRCLDLAITSLEGLKPSNGLLSTLMKTEFYAVVSLVNTTSISTQKTQTGNFETKNQYRWNSPVPMKFYEKESKLLKNSAIVMIQIRSKRPFCLDKIIGEVYVPLKDLYEKTTTTSASDHNNKKNNKCDQTQNDSANVAVYRVVMTRSKTASIISPRKVFLTFSFKFSDPFKLNRGAIARDFNETTSQDNNFSCIVTNTNPAYQLMMVN